MSTEDLRTALVKVGRRANIIAREAERSGMEAITSRGSAYGLLQLQLGKRKRLPEKRAAIAKLSQAELRRYLAIGQSYIRSESATVEGYRGIQERQIKSLMESQGISRQAAETFRSIMAALPMDVGYSPEALDFAEKATAIMDEEGGRKYTEQEIVEAYKNAFDVRQDELDIQKAYDALGIKRYEDYK